MIRFLQFLSLFATLPALSFAVPLLAPIPTSAQTSNTQAPQTTFPDVPSNYWARPFIQRLAQRNILTGYPDGTYRPERTMQREELAAVIRKAFNEPPVRQIESGSVYKDVEQGYWAEPPIESAIEQGFMSGDGKGYFRPNQPVTKAQAITILNRGLDLSSAVASTGTTSTRRTARRKPVFAPIAITCLMQSVLIPRAEAAPSTVAPKATNQTAQPKLSASPIVSNYYVDANRIPQNAVDDVAAATLQNIVVNHPNPKVLEPNKAATRAEIAALVHQALVSQGRLEPLAANAPANQYIVRVR
ncbi:S-layer domain-containing protein [Calothrix sp. NIES-4071]|nr:S-layer domain-containing protein [Calothrix sp. NIES-4071]BAZ54613.1 S-layer domain-containing protein [Calothrix sp. NIES-4105]